MIPRRRLAVAPTDALEALRGLWRGPRGQDVIRFEHALAGYLEYPGLLRCTCSGRDALDLALEALGLQDGDEIIVPAYTLGELVVMLRGRGYVPVAADVEPDTFNIAPQSVERHITPRTRAILALHLHGAPCDIRSICDLARTRCLAVVEDCAHALGACVGGRKVGAFGDAAFFSFESNKSLAAYGGGAVAVKDAARGACIAAALERRQVRRWPLAKKLSRYWMEEAVVRSPLYALAARVVFSQKFSGAFEKRYRRTRDNLRSTTSAFTDFQARLALRGLESLDRRQARLNALWDRFAAALPSSLRAQERRRTGSPAFYNFAVVCDGIAPAELRGRLLERGVDIGIGAEVMDDCARLLASEDCPVAADIFRRACTLPLHEGVTPSRLEKMIRAVRAAVS